MTLETPDHAALVIDARRGDAGAFGELYRRFGRLVHGLLLARIPADDAADVAQEVFMQPWTMLGTLREPEAFGTWIAALTGLTPASVRVNLHRGFRLLRQRLGGRA